jgi:hypothetical protein
MFGVSMRIFSFEKFDSAGHTPRYDRFPWSYGYMKDGRTLGNKQVYQACVVSGRTIDR